MNPPISTRRRFVTSTALTMAASLSSRSPALGAGVHWTIGCFNRAWAAWPSGEALAGVRAAGYQTVGLISNHADNPFALPGATKESIAALRKSLEENKLEANLTALRYDENADDEAIDKSVLSQLDHAQAIGVHYVMTFGTDRPENHDRYLRLMKRAAAWAADRKLKLVLKPHGGISAASIELQHCLDTVAHPNFSLWYDAGNILHYTGKDPVAELKPIAKHVTGFCAKDCPGQGGEVMIQFGTGRVDFKGVFSVLKEAGFDGPIMVEGIKVGATPEATTDFARANREYLERILASL